jgi:hypothetical protein
MHKYHKISLCKNKHADSQHIAIQQDDKLIHEHDLIAARIKKGSFLVYCTSCGLYYCEVCGQAS